MDYVDLLEFSLAVFWYDFLHLIVSMKQIADIYSNANEAEMDMTMNGIQLEDSWRKQSYGVFYMSKSHFSIFCILNNNTQWGQREKKTATHDEHPEKSR